jgi:hypothetical protein
MANYSFNLTTAAANLSTTAAANISTITNTVSVVTNATEMTSTQSTTTTDAIVLSTLPLPNPGSEPGHLILVLPVVVGVLFFLAGGAWLLFHFIHGCELWTLVKFHRFCGCCFSKTIRRKDEYRYLNDDAFNDEDDDTVFLKGKIDQWSLFKLIGHRLRKFVNLKTN